MLGIPLAVEKVEGPTTSLVFLGIQLDSRQMEARLPPVKLIKVQELVASWLSKKNATKREILSLVGLLQHAAKVVRPGRSFVRRMFMTVAKVKELDHFTRLNKEFRSDLLWWHTFLLSWNGISFIQVVSAGEGADLVIQTDHSGSWGCAAFFEGRWFQWKWPSEWSLIAIMAKELVPIVLSCAVWGPCMSRKRVLFQCDYSSAVAAIQKGSAKESLVMHRLRSLWFFVACFDITVKAEHLPGSLNSTADQLSRNQMSHFFHCNPQVDLLPTPLPVELLEIVSMTGPDWTSPAFTQLFSTIINRVLLPQPKNLIKQGRNGI